MTLDPNVASDPNGTGSQNAGNGGAADPNVATDPGVQTQPQAQPVGKTYTEAEWNTRAAQLRRSEEFRYNQNVERIRAEYDRLAQQQRQAPTTQSDEQRLFEEPIEKALDAFLQQRLSTTLAPMRERLEAADLNSAISKGRDLYPGFKDNETAILETMVAFGEKVVNSAPLDWLVQQAYYAHKQANFDEKKFKDATIKEYVDSARKRSATASPQGPGGTAPATPATDFGKKSWDDVSRAGQAEFERVRRAQAGV